MEVDTNELLNRIGAVLRVISDKMDRLIEIVERVEGQVRLPSEEESKTDAEEPAEEAEPEHPAGPKPSPGEGYRILKKDPPEDLQPGDEFELVAGQWGESLIARTSRQQNESIWYRRKIEVAQPPKPAWEPKVGDWVLVTRPEDWIEWDFPKWEGWMNHFDGKVGQVQEAWESNFQIVGFAGENGFRCEFHPSWLSPAKEAEPEHPAGPMPDPGEGYRILKKDPPEDLQPGDEYELAAGQWVESANVHTNRKQGPRIWYRRKIEPPKPAWEPKVGDWVLVTRPEDWIEWRHPRWEGSMHKFDGQVGQIEREREGRFHIRGFAAAGALRYQFHRDWLSPATTSQPLKIPPSLATVSGSGVRDSKPAEPQYRIPSLPADAGKVCEFSNDGNEWTEGQLRGYAGCFWQSVFGESVGVKRWYHCRIKKDA